MRDKMMNVMLKLALCPGTCDTTNPETVCSLCPQKGKAECADLLKQEAQQLLDVPVKKEYDVETRVTDVIHTLGVPAHIKGYSYLRRAIVLCVAEPELISLITKALYPKVAREFDTTSSRVERAIRHAIEVAWDRGDIDVLQRYFGNTVSLDKGKPTNGEFIALVTDRIRLEMKKEVN